jgi:hypothetical protein
MSEARTFPGYEGVADYAPHCWTMAGTASVIELAASWGLNESQRGSLLAAISNGLAVYASEVQLQDRHAELVSVPVAVAKDEPALPRVSRKRAFTAALARVKKMAATKSQPKKFNNWGGKLVLALESGELPSDAFVDGGLRIQISLDDLAYRHGDTDALIATVADELRKAAARSESKHGRGPAPNVARYRLVAVIGRAMRDVGIEPTTYTTYQGRRDVDKPDAARWANLVACVLERECGERPLDVGRLVETTYRFL